MKHRVEVSISATEIAQYLAYSGDEYKELLEFMQLMDISVADAGFTEDLIKSLVYSLKNDREGTDLPFIDWDKV